MMSRLSFVLLLALIALTYSIGLISAESNQDELIASERTRAVLELDKMYQERLEKEYALKINKPLEQVRSNMRYNYQVASALFWHSVSAYCPNDSGLSGWSCPSCKQFGKFTVTAVMSSKVNQGYVSTKRSGMERRNGETPLSRGRTLTYSSFFIS